jgi:hypothetical protein
VFWSVDRGLADLRAGGNTLLSLRVILDEGGGKLAPASRGSPPVPTPDALDLRFGVREWPSGWTPTEFSSRNPGHGGPN